MAILPKHLANEIAGHSVRLDCVTSAGVLTERMVSDASGCGTTGDERPVRADGTPEDVALATLYVISDASA